MGRPKGSKNKPRDLNSEVRTAMAEVRISTPLEISGDGECAIQGAPTLSRPPERITITLTDADLEPARRAKAAHAKAAAKFQREEIQSEIRRREIGEIEELSVPQVQPFDLSGAFMKIAERKAREAGYRFVHHLRKEAGAWVFEASNRKKEIPDAPTDQP